VGTKLAAFSFGKSLSCAPLSGPPAAVVVEGSVVRHMMEHNGVEERGRAVEHNGGVDGTTWWRHWGMVAVVLSQG
jgi:hypothetical protein